MSSDRYANCVTPTAPSFQLCSTYKVSGQSYKTTKARWVLQPVWPDAEIKSSPIFLQKMPKMFPTQFLLEKWYCQNNPIDIIHVGVLYNKIFTLKFIKIAQCGHTGCHRHYHQWRHQPHAILRLVPTARTIRIKSQVKRDRLFKHFSGTCFS